MKPGFKPKLFTKKEWQDNRDPALKGSGVGAALDQWQKHCPKDVGALDKEEIVKAFKVSKELLAALKKAEDAAKAKGLLDEIKGVEAYKKKVLAYQTLLKSAAVPLGQRDAVRQSMKKLDTAYAAMSKDPGLKEAVTAAAKKAFVFEAFDAWILWKEKKYPAMVARYAKDNDYNIPGPENEILKKAFSLDKSDRTKDVLDKLVPTLQGLGSHFKMMVQDDFFNRGDRLKASLDEYLAEKYPVREFSLT